ncbi:sensor histidine kinase, partial [Staphylococcus epidermidis]|nr:sensor histidine kinase [Staphylococcus epidermidis]
MRHMKFAYIQSIRNEISIILIILLFFALIFYVFS